jgi:hypothetical protein
MKLEILEPHCEWTADAVKDPALWTEWLTPAELAELDVATKANAGRDLREVGKADFPLPTLGARIKRIENELINGRGFVQIRGVDRAAYSNDEMCMIYWGIGAHLGKPWAQNKHGHILGDVTDQGKSANDPTARGNELGGIKLGFHCDGSDLVGLMCLQTGVSGGLSAVANSVAIHNAMVREVPELAAELYLPQPYDYRGEQAPGEKPYYMIPVFTNWHGRLFVRAIVPYILASQRHPEAPTLTDRARAALQWLDDAAESGRWNVTIDFTPGDIQFINNFHVMHGRTEYVDDRAAGKVRHLKRLWLETEVLADRPPVFRRNVSSHWSDKAVISRLDAAE